MTRMKDIVEMLQNLKGTIHVFPLDDQCRSKVWDIERDIKGSLGIPVVNKGIEDCLKRRYVICIIKNKGFRPPPEATVVLMTDTGTVLGEEVLPGQKKRFLDMKENVVWLSEEFVVYPERRGGTKEYFLMPPVSFPEVSDIDGMKNVVSCSPAAPSDMMLREMHGYKDDPKLASILVGFDSDNIEP